MYLLWSHLIRPRGLEKKTEQNRSQCWNNMPRESRRPASQTERGRRKLDSVVFNFLEINTLECPCQLLNARALGIYRILIKITQKQWIKDKIILNTGLVLILLVLVTLYCLLFVLTIYPLF